MANRIYKHAVIAVVAGCVAFSPMTAKAQWAVVDAQAIFQLSQQLKTLKDQLETAKELYGQAKALHDAVGQVGSLTRPSFFKSGINYQRIFNQIALPVLDRIMPEGVSLPPMSQLGDAQDYMIKTLTVNAENMAAGNTRSSSLATLKKRRTDLQLLSVLNAQAFAKTSNQSLTDGIQQATEIALRAKTEVNSREQLKVIAEGISALIAEQVHQRAVLNQLLEVMSADIITRSKSQIVIGDQEDDTPWN